MTVAPKRHVTIDARMLHHSGIGTYIRGMVPRVMARRPYWSYSVIGDEASLRSAIPPAAADLIHCPLPIYGIREQLELARRIPRQTTLYWAPHYNVPVLHRGPMLVTVHDMAHLRLPEYRALARRIYARALFGFIKRRAAAVIFVSEFTRGEFVSLLGEPRGATETIHEGPLPDFFDVPRVRDHPPIAKPYFVYVGNAKPHKNLSTLLRAFERLRATMNARLVVIGRIDKLRTVDSTTVQRLQETEGIQVLGEVSVPVLKAVVADANALVFPSLYEGFGLPAVEAMALGCPVIASRAASLPEVCGDAALYVDPGDADHIAGVMTRVAGDDNLRQSLVSRGLRRARELDLDTAAARTCALMERVLSSPLRPT